MELKSWLKKNRVTQVAFASHLGVTQFYLSKILNGKYYPSRSLAINIETLTNGEVLAQDIMFPNTLLSERTNLMEDKRTQR